VSARERILERVRAALGAGPEHGPALPALPPLPADAAAGAPRTMPDDDLVARFAARLLAVGGEFLDPGHNAADAIAERLAAQAVRTVALGGGDELRAVAAALQRRGIVCLPPTAVPADLFAADAGVTMAQWGIAETGTIVLDADAATARAASLVPPLHVALLPRSRVLPDLDAALAVLPQPVPHAVTLVTGPSRTADIELQLVVGVHGPRALIVVFT